LVDVLTPIRKGEDDDMIKQLFMEVCQRREPFYKASSRSSKR